MLPYLEKYSPLMTKKSAPSVLVVDDEPLIRWSVAETLGERGYAVTEADNAADRALAAIMNAPKSRSTSCFSTTGCRTLADLRLLATLRRLAPASQVIMMTATAARSWSSAPRRWAPLRSSANPSK